MFTPGIQKYKQIAPYLRMVEIWNKIVSIGLTAYMSDWDKKRIRLLNGISAMAIITLLIYCLRYLDHEHRLTFWESFQGLVGYIFVLILTGKHKYNAACHFFNIYNIVSYSFQAITHGSVDGVEYILVPSSIASMLLFRDLRIILFYFGLNCLCFAICKYSFIVMKPVFFMPNGENVYAFNHAFMFIILFLIVYYFKSENLRQEKLLETKNLSLSHQKHESDVLLLNILPYETAEELKHTGTAKPKSFNMVTVMFTNFKNFTQTAEKLSPEKLVGELHHYFCMFDSIISKYNIEKIKTIGDSYMCAGGLPQENHSNPADVIMAALEIQEFMLNKKKEKEILKEIFFELTLGIHTGSVVAGIVGTKKFAYDIWGDTVNIASRMESNGQTGKVNISGATYEMVKKEFNCVYRGKISAKNKGEIDMYFVNGYTSPIKH